MENKSTTVTEGAKMTTSYQYEKTLVAEAKNHEDHGHKLTYEDLPNGRVHWFCRSCGMQGSFIEDLSKVA